MGKRLLLPGVGGHGKVVREVALSILGKDGEPVYEAVDFLDNNAEDVLGLLTMMQWLENLLM